MSQDRIAGIDVATNSTDISNIINEMIICIKGKQMPEVHGEIWECAITHWLSRHARHTDCSGIPGRRPPPLGIDHVLQDYS